MARASFQVRPARRDELPEVAKLAATMVRQHHQYDPQRFSLFREPIEAGYEGWLAHEVREERSLVLVAVETVDQGAEAKVLGYAYARLESADWTKLLAACGFLHDLVVAPEARRRGVATALVEAVADWMAQRGAPRMVLETAAPNQEAQAFFRARGFRPTMIEMTRELPASGAEDE